MRTCFVLVLIILFVASSIPAFAGAGKATCEKTVFQATADPIKGFTGKVAPPDKYEAKGMFQKCANNISGIGKKSKTVRPAPKNIFQSTAGDLSEFESWIKGEKSTYHGTPDTTFQKMKGYIEKNVKASQKMQAQSLRGRKDELARRRSQ